MAGLGKKNFGNLSYNGLQAPNRPQVPMVNNNMPRPNLLRAATQPNAPSISEFIKSKNLPDEIALQKYIDMTELPAPPKAADKRQVKYSISDLVQRVNNIYNELDEVIR